MDLLKLAGEDRVLVMLEQYNKHVGRLYEVNTRYSTGVNINLLVANDEMIQNFNFLDLLENSKIDI